MKTKSNLKIITAISMAVCAMTTRAMAADTSSPTIAGLPEDRRKNHSELATSNNLPGTPKGFQILVDGNLGVEAVGYCEGIGDGFLF